jgi:hypothetical protein
VQYRDIRRRVRDDLISCALAAPCQSGATRECRRAARHRR